MAIAFSLPSDECTLEHYRRIQQLLMDLINLLRTLINTETPIAPSPSPNSPVPATGSHFGFPTPPSSVPNSPSPFLPSAASATSAFALPDVVSSSASIEELRNYLISRNCTSSVTGPPSVVSAATGSVPQSMQRPNRDDESESQRISEMVVEPVHHHGRGSLLSAAAKLRKRKRARISRKQKGCPECCSPNESATLTSSSSSSSLPPPPYLNQSNQTTMLGTPAAATTCYSKIPNMKATQNECSCNDVPMSGTDDNCATNAKVTPNHRQHHHHHHHHQHHSNNNNNNRRHHHHQNHQITRNYVPSTADSEFYMDPTYYRRIAAAADAATGADYKSDTSWVYVGEEFKKMTDGFRQTNIKDEKLPEEDLSESKGLNGLISQCGRTVFAAALLVIGWKLLKQN